MSIRHLALALPLVACLDAQEPSLGEQEGNIICAPLCTPGYASLLEDTYSFGFRLLPDAGTLDEACAEIGPGWDCMVTLLSPTTNSCGRVVVECQQQPGALPPRCRSLTPAGCQ